jgi:hypothetical protein
MQCEMVDLEAVEAGARYWGSRAKVSYAEAFETPRFLWEIGAGTASDKSSTAETADEDSAWDTVVAADRLVSQRLAGASW